MLSIMILVCLINKVVWLNCVPVLVKLYQVHKKDVGITKQLLMTQWKINTNANVTKLHDLDDISQNS